MSNIELIALMAVLLVGIPHGGLDGAIARRQGWPPTKVAWIGFHLLYLSLAFLVILLWQLFPLFCLGIFLVISGIHFARSDCGYNLNKNWVPLIAHGGLVPIVIPFAQASEVIPIFTLLVGEANALLLLSTIEMLVLPWLVSVLIYAHLAVNDRFIRSTFFALLCLIIAALVLPPLVSFALYFCVFHSPRHMRGILSKLSSKERHRGLYEMIVYSLIAIGAIILCAVYFQKEMQLLPKLLQVSFIGIAALTVPHMLLVDYDSNSKRRLY